MSSGVETAGVICFLCQMITVFHSRVKWLVRLSKGRESLKKEIEVCKRNLIKFYNNRTAEALKPQHKLLP